MRKILNLNRDVDAFTKAYIICALWASTDGDEPLDDNYNWTHISDKTLKQMVKDCRKFQTKFGIPSYFNKQYSDAELAGHDFFLTRNSHGCGFWDRNELTKGVQDGYTKASKSFGSFDLYVGDDGKLYA